MSAEQLPDPALPVFSDETVSILRLSEEHDGKWKEEQIPVDEIDTIADPRFREVLWSQFHKHITDSDYATVVFVKPDGSYSHAWDVRRRPMFSPDVIEKALADENSSDTVD